MMEETLHHTEHIPQWKKDEIKSIKDLINTYPLFAIAGIGGIPAKQFQIMRRELKDTAVLRVSRNTLINRALDEANEDIQKMNDFVELQTALIFTEENPFKLYKILEQSKTPSPIKAGTVAPKDIMVEKGPTSFPPGPILGDLQSVGIPAAIEQGKVVIKENKVVAKEGEVVSSKLAAMLARLEIHPLEVGMNLRAVYESGFIFTPDVLEIDENKYFNDISVAFQRAFNLSVNASYPTKANINILLSTAFIKSQSLGLSAEILEPDMMDKLISKAHSQMVSLATAASAKDESVLDDDLNEIVGARKESAESSNDQKSTDEVIDTEEKKEEEEDESEDSGMAGLGSLFG